MFWFFLRLSLIAHHSSYFYLSVRMSVAARKRYIEETKVKAQDAQTARAEARLVQLKLTQLESKIVELDNPLEDETDLSLSFLCVFFPYDLFPSITFRLIRVICLCVTLSNHPGLKRERER